MYYFSNKKLAKFARKRTKYGIFMIYFVLKQHSQKNTEKKKKKNLHL